MKTMLMAGAAMAAIVWVSPAFAASEGWTSDFEAAKKEAAESGKDLLIDFTGSDWCGWCIRLKDEVFKHDEFKTGVKDKFVLVEIDFPQDKSILSEETQKQNQALGEKYQVRGYPTILLADAEGKPFGVTGYQEGGPEKYVAHLDELRGNKEVRDKGLEAASQMEGVEKAKALVEVLDSLGGLSEEAVEEFYGSISEDIQAADPEDVTGYTKKVNSKKRFAEFEKELSEFGQKQDHDGALSLVEAKLQEGDWDTEQKQRIALIKTIVLAQQQKADEALVALEEARKIAPDSELAGNFDRIKGQLEAMKAAAADGGEGAEDEE